MRIVLINRLVGSTIDERVRIDERVNDSISKLIPVLGVSFGCNVIENELGKVRTNQFTNTYIIYWYTSARVDIGGLAFPDSSGMFCFFSSITKDISCGE